MKKLLIVLLALVSLVSLVSQAGEVEAFPSKMNDFGEKSDYVYRDFDSMERLRQSRFDSNLMEELGLDSNNAYLAFKIKFKNGEKRTYRDGDEMTFRVLGGSWLRCQSSLMTKGGNYISGSHPMFLDTWQIINLGDKREYFKANKGVIIAGTLCKNERFDERAPVMNEKNIETIFFTGEKGDFLKSTSTQQFGSKKTENIFLNTSEIKIP